VPSVRGRACGIALCRVCRVCRPGLARAEAAQGETRRGSHRDSVSFDEASARPPAVARAVPDDVSLLHIAHAYSAIMAHCATPADMRARLVRASGADSSTACLNTADDALRGTSVHEQEAQLLVRLSRMNTAKQFSPGASFQVGQGWMPRVGAGLGRGLEESHGVPRYCSTRALG
jgi:hypothetical protein